MLKKILIASALLVASIASSPPAFAGGGGHCPSGFTDSSTTEVTIEQSCFLTTVVRVPVGATVTWTNKDEYRHTVTGFRELFMSNDLNENDVFTAKFERSGTFPYSCVYHPGMVGAVVVGDGGAIDSTEGAVSVAGSTQEIGSKGIGAGTKTDSFAHSPAAAKSRLGNIGGVIAGVAIGAVILAPLLMGRRRGKAARELPE